MPDEIVNVIYVHGFASSARSSKAAFFARRFAEYGIELHTPDLNLPDFSTLTITRMLQQVTDLIEEPVTLIGSSLGAFVAVQAAARDARVHHVVLLAPALEFGGNRVRQMGEPGLERWRQTNRLDVFHYGYGRVMPVHYELYADASRYDAVNAAVSVPVQAFQGTRDTAVDPATVERWARARANVELHMLDDDHQLLGSLEFIWQEMIRFLALGRLRGSP